jgi:hypothetical protein
VYVAAIDLSCKILQLSLSLVVRVYLYRTVLVINRHYFVLVEKSGNALSVLNMAPSMNIECSKRSINVTLALIDTFCAHALHLV